MTIKTYTPQAKVTLFKNIRRDEAGVSQRYRGGGAVVDLTPLARARCVRPMTPAHWSDSPAAVAELARRARRAVAARVALEDAPTRVMAVKAFRQAGEQPLVPDIGRLRAAVTAIGIQRPLLAADLRPLIERLYTLDLLARAG